MGRVSIRGAGSRAAVVAVVLASVGMQCGARADVYVIESTVPAIKAGSQLADADSLSVPAGASVRVLLPSGKTQTIKGPHDGSVANIGKGELSSTGMIAWLRTFLHTGGANEATPGVTRSFSGPTARATGFSWTTVVTGTDGVLCVPKGTELQLKRAITAKADQVTVVDRETSARGEAEWGVGKDSTPWPASVALRSGATYDILIPDRPKRAVTLRVLPKVPEEADVLKELHAQGCKAQFEAWLRDSAQRR